MKKRSALKNEDGSVLVVALVILVLLTIAGMTSNRTSSTDMLIANNEKVYKQNLFLAEAVAMEAIQSMEDTDLEDSPPAWLTTDLNSISEADVLNDGNWTAGFSDGTNAVQSTLSTAARYVAVSAGIDPGTGLGMGGSRVYSYQIFGRGNQNNGRSIILVGYRKAF